MYCENCGTEIDDEAVVCPKCGCSVEQQLEQVETVAKTTQEKKYCSKCGEQIHKDAVICPKCGCYTDTDGKRGRSIEHNQPKTGMGVVMGLFLNIYGLVIGLLLYPDGTVARKTFVKSWIITFLVSFGVSILLLIVLWSTYFALLIS